jgi:hypothetical protein
LKTIAFLDCGSQANIHYSFYTRKTNFIGGQTHPSGEASVFPPIESHFLYLNVSTNQIALFDTWFEVRDSGLNFLQLVVQNRNIIKKTENNIGTSMRQVLQLLSDGL